MATRHQVVAVGQLGSSVRGRTERATGSACTATGESDRGCSPQVQRIRVRNGVSQTHRLACVRAGSRSAVWAPRAVTARCRSLELGTFLGIENVALAPEMSRGVMSRTRPRLRPRAEHGHNGPYA